MDKMCVGHLLLSNRDILKGISSRNLSSSLEIVFGESPERVGASREVVYFKEW